jgi:hypothetical protein
MNRYEKIKLIRGLVNGSVSPIELKRGIEVWVQQIGTNIYHNYVSNETSTFEVLKERESIIGDSRLIVVQFVKGKSIL